MATKQERTWVQVVIDRDLHKQLKVYASSQEASLKQVAEQALSEYMERNPVQAA